MITSVQGLANLSCCCMQVRNVQLDQEAQELRTENNTLAAVAQQSKMSEAAIQQVSCTATLLADLPGCKVVLASCLSAKQLTCAMQMAAHDGRMKELQEELTTAYKEKGKLAEDLLQAGAAIHAR